MRIRIVLLTVALVTASAAVGAQTPSVSSEPVVVVSGEAIVKAAPDRAFVVFAVENRSKNPKEAQSQNAKSMTSVHERLMGAGLSKEAIRTLSYDVSLESDWVNGRQVPRGYVARNTIEVRLDEVTRVGEIIDAAITSGANSVHGVRFDLKNRDALEREALKRATADARARAEAAASGAGGSIGRVLRIEEPFRGSPGPPMPVMMREAAQDARVASTPIVAGEIEIRATVVLTATLR
jgi:uncharacterized protein YggE